MTAGHSMSASIRFRPGFHAVACKLPNISVLKSRKSNAGLCPRNLFRAVLAGRSSSSHSWCSGAPATTWS